MLPAQEWKDHKKGEVMNASENNNAIIARLLPDIQKYMSNLGTMEAWMATLTAAEQGALTVWLSKPGDRLHDMLKRIDVR
jgi:hypothetical protein